MSISKTIAMVVMVALLGGVTVGFRTFIYKNQNSNVRSKGALFLYSTCVGFVLYVFAALSTGGAFEEWVNLGLVNSEKAMKFVEIGFVETETGNIYRKEYLDGVDSTWQLVEDVSDSHDCLQNEYPNCYYSISDTDCGSLTFVPFHSKDFLDYEEACLAWGVGLVKVAYAISNNGELYYWEHRLTEWTGFANIPLALLAAFICLVLGSLYISSKGKDEEN